MNKEMQIELLEDVLKKVKEDKAVVREVNIQPITEEYLLAGMEIPKIEIIGSTIDIHIETFKGE